MRDGLVYLQVTRGAGPREFAFPARRRAAHGRVPGALDLAARRRRRTRQTGIAVKTMPDIRWRRCDIKTVMLLPACLAKKAAQREGAREAWLVDGDGFVTEGASSNAWIVDRRRAAVITRQIDARYSRRCHARDADRSC